MKTRFNRRIPAQTKPHLTPPRPVGQGRNPFSYYPSSHPVATEQKLLAAEQTINFASSIPHAGGPTGPNGIGGGGDSSSPSHFRIDPRSLAVVKRHVAFLHKYGEYLDPDELPLIHLKLALRHIPFDATFTVGDLNTNPETVLHGGHSEFVFLFNKQYADPSEHYHILEQFLDFLVLTKHLQLIKNGDDKVYRRFPKLSEILTEEALRQYGTELLKLRRLDLFQEEISNILIGELGIPNIAIFLFDRDISPYGHIHRIFASVETTPWGTPNWKEPKKSVQNLIQELERNPYLHIQGVHVNYQSEEVAQFLDPSQVRADSIRFIHVEDIAFVALGSPVQIKGISRIRVHGYIILNNWIPRDGIHQAAQQLRINDQAEIGKITKQIEQAPAPPLYGAFDNDTPAPLQIANLGMLWGRQINSILQDAQHKGRNFAAQWDYDQILHAREVTAAAEKKNANSF